MLGDNHSYTVVADPNPPELLSIRRFLPSRELVSQREVQFMLTFSKSVDARISDFIASEGTTISAVTASAASASIYWLTLAMEEGFEGQAQINIKGYNGTAGSHDIRDALNQPMKNQGNAPIESYQVDISAPQVEFHLPATVAQQQVVNFDISFDDLVSGFEASDLLITGGQLVDLQEYLPQPGRYQASVLVNGDELIVTLPDNAVQNTLGTGNEESSVSATVDQTPPTVEITAPDSMAPSGTASLLLTFSEAIEELNRSSFNLNGVAIADIQRLNNLKYEIEVQALVDNGQVEIELVADNIRDLNALPMENNASVAIAISSLVSIASLTNEPDTLPINQATELELSFTLPVTGFSQADIKITGGQIASFNPLNDQQFRFEVIAESGFVILEIAEGAGQHQGENSAAFIHHFLVDSDYPFIQSTEGPLQVIQTFENTLIFNEAIEIVDEDAITVSNGTLNQLQQTQHRRIRIDITPDGNGDIEVRIPVGAIRDLSGLNSENDLIHRVEYDVTPPEPVEVKLVRGNRYGAMVEVLFSEPVERLNAMLTANPGAYTVGGRHIVTQSEDKTKAFLELTRLPASEFNLIVIGNSLNNVHYADLVGNAPTHAQVSYPVVVDAQGPQISFENIPAEIIDANEFSIDIRFDEDIQELDISRVMLTNAEQRNLICQNRSCQLTLAANGGGDIEIQLAHTLVKDQHGNPSVNSVQTIPLNISQPLISWVSPPQQMTSLPSILRLKANQDLTGLTPDDLIITGGQISGWNETDPQSYQFNVTPDDNSAQVSLQVMAGSATNIVGTGIPCFVITGNQCRPGSTAIINNIAP